MEESFMLPGSSSSLKDEVKTGAQEATHIHIYSQEQRKNNSILAC